MIHKATLINALLFQLVWFGCVLGGGVYGNLWFGLAPLVLLVLSLNNSSCMRQDVLLVLIALPLGWLLDTLWVRLGILVYPEPDFAPPWLALLWVGVALTINHSLTWLRDRPALGAIVVALCAPISYLAGQRLGAIAIPVLQDLWMISVAWGLLFWLMFLLARRGLARWARDQAVNGPANEDLNPTANRGQV